MKGLVLGNIDYRSHMTDEGDQLQRGLEYAGWKVAGVGFDDDCADVPTLLERHQPTHVLVHDKRDWDPRSKISFRKDIGFARLSELASRDDIIKLAVVKDAATFQDYTQEFCEEIRADALVVYYHPKSILQHAAWIQEYPLIRTWHSIDANLARGIEFKSERKRAVVTGAKGRDSYPLRYIVMRRAKMFGVDNWKHPGYGNAGSATPRYLWMLSGYRVHIATASRFGFALRKIMESVAMGCTPVTNLPPHDVLPEIDDALVRIPTGANEQDIRLAIDKADEEWNPAKRVAYARKANWWYDWRQMGKRLSFAMELVRKKRTTCAEGVSS